MGSRKINCAYYKNCWKRNNLNQQNATIFNDYVYNLLKDDIVCLMSNYKNKWIGYLTKIKNWSSGRQIEQKTRVYDNKVKNDLND